MVHGARCLPATPAMVCAYVARSGRLEGPHHWAEGGWLRSPITMPMAARRDKTAQLQQNLYIKDRERLQIERQHWQIRSLALAYITVATASILALSWALIE
jgi:hypothetical protein